MKENNDEIYVVYKDDKLWSGENASARKVRAYSTRSDASAVINRRVRQDVKTILDEKRIHFWHPDFKKEYEITTDNELSRYKVKTFVEKNL